LSRRAHASLAGGGGRLVSHGTLAVVLTLDNAAVRLEARTMDDQPDPSSPFFIVRNADPSDHGSTVQLDSSSIEAGPPLQIGWKIPYYGKPDHRPVDIYSGSELRRLCRKGQLPPSPVMVSAEYATRGRLFRRGQAR
jgi:hypothetical protein